MNFRVACFAIFWGLFSATSPMALTEEENGAFLGAAFDAVEKDDWDRAFALSRQISDPVAVDIIEWRRLRAGGADWQDYLSFLENNKDWPGLSTIRARGEGAIPVRHTPSEVFAYFKDHPPQSGIGVLRLTEALLATGKEKEANAEAIRAWTTFAMTKAERVQVLSRFKDVLKDHHIPRLDMLLWRGLKKPAEGLYTLVPAGHVKLAKARLALQKKSRGVDALIAEIPEALKGDAGLAYERFAWRSRKGLYNAARDLMLERSTTRESLGRPEKWSERRRSYARQEMRNGENARAYQLASQHFMTEGSNYADLEWLAGYIALRKLNDPENAVYHFKRFQSAVATPISYGRAGYWLGLAYDALGDRDAAIQAYKFGAAHQTSFYGQLAAERIGAAPDVTLNGNGNIPNWREAEFVDSSVLRAALLYHYAEQAWMTEWFIKHLGESLDATGLQQLAELTLEIGRPSITVRLSKQAVKQGHVLPKTYFPVTDLAGYETAVEPELAMSIARRESELDQFVVSPAGALGLMQVMPKTARTVAGTLGLSYAKRRLTEDWEYNATLGSAYLAMQLKAFNGSYILAFAAYNAGPHRAKRWIERYGDPRKDSVDQVDWIEHIPFRETRNYVMRVMESVYVYRARISGKTPRLTISSDLKKG